MYGYIYLYMKIFHKYDLFIFAMFGSMVCLLAIQFLISNHTQIVRQGLHLVEWPSSLTKYHLATPTSSVPAMPQHILQAG